MNVVGNGSVAVNPEADYYLDGASVMLTATTGQDWNFAGWSGALTGMTNPAMITMDMDKVVTATFTAIPTYTLEVNVVGNGSVDLNPNAAFYLEGTSVMLTAIPDQDWYFAGWSGDLGGADNPATIMMDDNKVVTVTFTEEEPVLVTLTVNVTGSGSVTKSPSAATYISGSVVSLTAMPAVGWQFDAWSGDLMGTTNPSTLVMDADKTVTATFIESMEEFMIYLPLVSREYTP